MKIYLLIKPQDYTFADAEVFYSKKSAEQEIINAKQSGEKDTNYWRIQEETI